jgi:hypothetical protein
MVCQEPLLKQGSKRTLSEEKLQLHRALSLLVIRYNEVPHSNKRGITQACYNELSVKKKQLHRAHATTSQRTAGYRKVAAD